MEVRSSIRCSGTRLNHDKLGLQRCLSIHPPGAQTPKRSSESVKKTLEVGNNNFALPLQMLDLPCDLNPPFKQLIRREGLEVGEWLVAFK